MNGPTLIELKKPESDVRSTLQELLDNSEKLEGVIVLTLNKDGTQFMYSSTLSGYKKMFLVQFLNSWASKWFGEQYNL